VKWMLLECVLINIFFSLRVDMWAISDLWKQQDVLAQTVVRLHYVVFIKWNQQKKKSYISTG
jgi:hypothetical protein